MIMDALTAPRARKRALSKNPRSVRRRRERAKNKSGLACVQLWIPVERIKQAIRRRDGLPDNAPISRRHLLRSLNEGLLWWSGIWRDLRRNDVARDRPGKDNR
jgi:hypothetical protein